MSAVDVLEALSAVIDGDCMDEEVLLIEVSAAVAELVEALQEIAECTTPGDGVPNTDWVHERARAALARVGGAS